MCLGKGQGIAISWLKHAYNEVIIIALACNTGTLLVLKVELEDLSYDQTGDTKSVVGLGMHQLLLQVDLSMQYQDMLPMVEDKHIQPDFQSQNEHYEGEGMQKPNQLVLEQLVMVTVCA